MTLSELLSLLAIIVLLFLSALFSGSETAFTGSSRAYITRLARAGDRRATRLGAMRERKDRLIAALLVGNNLVNTTATALASALLIAWFGAEGVVYASLVMTVTLVILSEVLPKTYAIQHPDSTALRATPMLALTLRLFGPVARVVNWLVAAILSVFGVKVATGERAQTDEDLRGVIALHGLGEADDAAIEERRMLHGVLELDEMTVADVMTHRRRIVGIDADAPPAKRLERLLTSPYSRIPLWRADGQEIIGVVDVKAALRALQAVGGDPARLDLAAIAERVPVVPEVRPLFDQLQEFRRTHRHIALVLDEYGQLRGLLTLEDVIEVIVGEISERGESILADSVTDEGAIEVRGDTRVRDLNRELDWHLPEDEAATVAGLVLHVARGLPTIGTTVSASGYDLTVTELRGRRITAVRIAVPTTTPGA
ncbi:HlyC/CorC family transporter [Elioraea rosea]|uniref:HlyC/CorC family transporter n=1 Tax=Elioraea rosea TaxID=2492390 RepID=UPI001185333D|nr:CNNM domain-containing protein [Elioraea rosea]